MCMFNVLLLLCLLVGYKFVAELQAQIHRILEVWAVFITETDVYNMSTNTHMFTAKICALRMQKF